MLKDSIELSQLAASASPRSILPKVQEEVRREECERRIYAPLLRSTSDSYGGTTRYAVHSSTEKTKSSRRSLASFELFSGRNRKICLRMQGVLYSTGNLNISAPGLPAMYLYFRGSELDIQSHGQ